mmetsp:Transcript_14233/g.20460  ORF Transcript_14233/g.20460 Transcript_14233/m.20460 type:complete len:81 (+) Transcript_14233:354-596(+)
MCSILPVSVYGWSNTTSAHFVGINLEFRLCNSNEREKKRNHLWLGRKQMDISNQFHQRQLYPQSRSDIIKSNRLAQSDGI